MSFALSLQFGHRIEGALLICACDPVMSAAGLLLKELACLYGYIVENMQMACSARAANAQGDAYCHSLLPQQQHSVTYGR